MENIQMKCIDKPKPIEKFLQLYFSALGTFAWDKARDVVEKNKQLILSNIPEILFNNLKNLCINEKLYFSLEFLQSKWFQNNTKVEKEYNSIQGVFSNFFKAGGDEKIINLFSSCEFVEICGFRAKTLKIFEDVAKTGSSIKNHVSYSKICDKIEELIKDVEINLKGTFCNSFKANMLEEMELLNSLLQASSSVANWDFTQSTYALQRSHTILLKWKPFFNTKTSIRTGFFSFTEKSSNPTSALYNWFENMYKMLNSKSIFYFYESYSQSLSLEELRHVCGKTSYDFAGKATSFLKKHDGEYVQLYLTRNKRDGPIRHGYKFPSSGGAEEYNLQCDVDELDFHLVLTLRPTTQSHCEVSDLDGKELVRKMRANWNSLDKVPHNYNCHRSFTQYCSIVDTRIAIVVSMKGSRSEKDPSINSFLQENVVNLRRRRILFCK